MRKKESFLYCLNPQNVSAAIERYGYTYRIRNTVLVYLAVCLLSAAGGMVFRLRAVGVCLIAVCGMAMMPRVLIHSYKNMYEQKRFSDVNLYIEQVLYSFRKTPKIISALQDVERILAKDSPMLKTVKESVRYILHEYSEEHPLDTGLKMIEEKYNCQRLKDAHALMLKTERIGGDYESSVKILLSGRAVWETETCKFQKECKSRQRMVNVALILVCGVCLFTPLVILKFAPAVDITASPVYQCGTVGMILVSMRTYIKADAETSVNWLRNESALSAREQRLLYEKVRHFNGFREKKKSLRWSLALCFAGILCVLLHLPYLVVLCGVCMLVTANQHKIGYQLAKRRCRDEIIKAFPQWLMEMSLLLQVSENVNAAIAASMEGAPAILAEGLEGLYIEMMEQPESNEPYMNFMKEFGIIEIQSAMGMLYSVSSGRGGDAGFQIEEILSKNTALLGQSEKMSNDSRLAALYWQFLFPSVIGGGKLIVDMTLVTIAFMSANLY